MKKKELAKYRKKSLSDLNKELDKLEISAAHAYAERKAGKDKNLKTVKNLRHDIAQMKTIIAQKRVVSAAEEK
jgi:ribosomal protein L29